MMQDSDKYNKHTVPVKRISWCIKHLIINTQEALFYGFLADSWGIKWACKVGSNCLLIEKNWRASVLFSINKYTAVVFYGVLSFQTNLFNFNNKYKKTQSNGHTHGIWKQLFFVSASTM